MALGAFPVSIITGITTLTVAILTMPPVARTLSNILPFKSVLNKILYAIICIAIFAVGLAAYPNSDKSDVKVSEYESITSTSGKNDNTTNKSSSEQTTRDTEIQTSSEMLTEIETVKNESMTTSDMEVHFIDVGQGDCTLISSNGHYMLIDAGDNNQGTKIRSYLQKHGVTDTLDYFIITHPDSDHSGGADVVITNYNIGTVISNGQTSDTATWRDVESALKYKNITPVTAAPGTEYQLGDAKFTIEGPCKTYSDDNNNSVVVLIQNGNNRFLLTGDCETEAEADITSSNTDIHADVYKAGHHGSSTATSDALLNAVAPSACVISCGADNQYGHPHAEVLNRLRSRNISVYRTDEEGSIIATSDGNTITWNCSPSDSWKAGEREGTATTSATTVTETTTQAQTIAESTAATSSYVCNTNTMKFHLPRCASVSRIYPSNRLDTSASRDELIAQGYEPCKNCNP